MDYNEFIKQLEVEWDLDGFFHRLRAGDFDATRSLTVLELLRSIKIDETQLLPRRLVSLLWCLPSFLDWQTDVSPKEMVTWMLTGTSPFKPSMSLRKFWGRLDLDWGHIPVRQLRVPRCSWRTSAAKSMKARTFGGTWRREG